MSNFPNISLGNQLIPSTEASVQGEFVERNGERFYRIEHAERMPSFFSCMVSDSDHWLFASSGGGLAAGRRNSSNSLFPYVTEDKISDNQSNTGPYTALLVTFEGRRLLWEPWSETSQLAYRTQRNLYKSVTGNKLGFEEINHDLGLRIYYEWCSSDSRGFVRQCELENLGSTTCEVELLDGLQNLLPACIDEQMQLGFSCLLDAYKMSENVAGSGLAAFSLGSQVVDKAEPKEALRATVAFGLGLPDAKVLLSSEQVAAFRAGRPVVAEERKRGRRGAFFQVARVSLRPQEARRWKLVADVERTQADVADLVLALTEPQKLSREIEDDIERGTRELRRIVAATDGIQVTQDEATTEHHFANTLFNDMRGGIYAEGFFIRGEDFMKFVHGRNRDCFERQVGFLEGLEERLEYPSFVAMIERQGDETLIRLSYEYLPLTFSRRHGDPSRPWNKFDIRVRDESGGRLLGYQGNWRDIFQNWEALSLSYPGFVESIIAKFVNASTVDGYNPYRITDSGIDWEEPEPQNPWAGIGYWGDHQVIYLLKLLEVSRAHHPQRLDELMLAERFTYANVPYRIKPFDEIRENPRDTIVFDHRKNEQIKRREAQFGSDARLLFERAEPGASRTVQPSVYRANLLEKLLVTSLSKMGNFVPGAGIWMNTQRPEWNDANNALVGNGVSMVTLCYLARFFHFLEDVVVSLGNRPVRLSAEVLHWLEGTLAALEEVRFPEGEGFSDAERGEILVALGELSSEYRDHVYERGFTRKEETPADLVLRYVQRCRSVLEHSIFLGERDDSLYHAYNLLDLREDGRALVSALPPMLEGQVAVLSSGVLSAEQALGTLDALRASALYREDQNSYMLYPNRELPSFLEKNRIPAQRVADSPLLALLGRSDSSIIQRDPAGVWRFDSSFYNAEVLREALVEYKTSGRAQVKEAEIEEVLGIYEEVFHHRAFTGRSGTMFGYEGLGSIYWHMVAKLMLAVQENYFWAQERGASPESVQRLAEKYYELRQGVGGFNKSPESYGAFPVDPYSHTPENSGARQPGMTGQVKEEILTRFGELGVQVVGGCLRFAPCLLRDSEFLEKPQVFQEFDASGRSSGVQIPAGSLAFSYCGLTVVYQRSPVKELRLTDASGKVLQISGDSLPADLTREVLTRSGKFTRLTVLTSAGQEG